MGEKQKHFEIPAKFNFDLKFQELLYNLIRTSAQYSIEKNQLSRFDTIKQLRVCIASALNPDRATAQKAIQKQAHAKVQIMDSFLDEYGDKISYDPLLCDYVNAKGQRSMISLDLQKTRRELDFILDAWEQELIKDMRALKLLFITDKTGADAAGL